MKKMDRLGCRQTYNQHLPSTELRGAIPGWEDGEESPLAGLSGRYYASQMVDYLHSGPQLYYHADFYPELPPRSIRPSPPSRSPRQSSQVTKFEEVVAAEVKALEFYETQVALLLAARRIDRKGHRKIKPDDKSDRGGNSF